MAEERSPRRRWLLAALAVFLVAGAAAAVVLVLGSDDEASAQTVRFQDPTDRGPDPFTQPTDRRGGDRVRVGSGPFGGTGSDLVCDRELLIDSLAARPDRMREWARVLGITPTQRAVADYIRHLRPVTLTRDTRVTNHSFVDGRAVAFQSILQAGTAVLVDKDGVPVARCRCGNPLLEPVHIPEATCYGCPPNYEPPPPCKYYDYDDSDYRRYGDGYFKRIYVRRDFIDVCYYPYPDPPRVNRRPYAPRRPPPPTQQATTPTASFSPSSGTTEDTYTLSISGFSPNTTIPFTLTRPDGVTEDYSITTNSAGSGSYTFPRTAGTPPLGTYTATVTDPRTGRSASASTTVSAATEAPPPQQDQGLNCEAPSSQLEFEQCRDAGQLPEQQEPQRDPNYQCDVDPRTPEVDPPAHPGEDWLRNCG